MNSFNTLSSPLNRGGGATYYKKYIIKVVSSVFSVDSVPLKDLTADFLPGKTYKFDQSDPTNVGYPLVFGVIPDGATITTAGITYTSYGTPGNPGAFTKLVVANNGFVAGVLYYYSLARLYMGYGPTVVTADVTTISTGGYINFTIINRKGSLAFSSTGVASSDFTGSPAISGNYTNLGLSTIQYQISTANSLYMTFTMDGIVKTVEINYIRYAVSVANNVFSLGGIQLLPVDFSANRTYVFRQDDSTNINFPIMFSTTPDGSPIGENSQWTVTTVTDP